MSGVGFALIVSLLYDILHAITHEKKYSLMANGALVCAMLLIVFNIYLMVRR